jgi:cytochrome P450
MKQITMAVIMRAMFGQSRGDGLSELPAFLDECVDAGSDPRFMALVDTAGQIRAQAWQERTRWSPWSRFLRLRTRLDGLLFTEIARRRAVAADRTDVMSLLMTMRDEAGQPLSDQAVRDHMLSLLVAGHKTTAAALTWTMYWLLREPAVYRQVQEELTTGRSEYLSLAIKEALRLSPPLAVVLRRVMRPERLGSHLLPPGVLVAPASYLVHRRADCWDEPLRFKPERFRARTNPYEYFPFGGGSRRCIGMAFALHEMNVVLSELLSAVPLELKSGYRPRTIRKGITFVIGDGLPVRRVAPAPARAAVPFVGTAAPTPTTAAPIGSAAD